jgi:hypothetical protein
LPGEKQLPQEQAAEKTRFAVNGPIAEITEEPETITKASGGTPTVKVEE